MIQPGTAVWFARHELRLAWRDWVAMMTAGKAARRRRVALGIAAFVIGMHAVAYFVVGGFATAVIDKHFLIGVSATVLLSWLLMVSQAMESITRAFYTRADLDLILASPVAAQRLFAVRIATVALAVAAMALPLAGPFINMLAFRGGWHWLGAYGVILAMGAAATAVAVALTVALFRIIGPKRTRLTAQVLAAIIGAAFVIGLQVAAILSYGTLSRADVLQSQTLEALAPDLTSAFWWPARAVLGDLPALAAVLTASVVLLAAVIALVAPRFGDYAIAASGAGASPAARPRRATSFRVASPRAALRRKEWLLLRRDPWLASQTLMQMLYLLPPAILLWRTFEAGGGALNLLVPVLVMAAGQLAGGLAWLTISGEDAPDLVATAPIPQRYVLRAKIEAVIAIIAVDLRAAGRGHRRRLALARGDHRRRHRHRGRVRHRDPALVPHPGEAQPIPPPPGVLARRHLRRSFFLHRLGRHRRGRRCEFVARHPARPDRARRRRRHAPAGAAAIVTNPPPHAVRGRGTMRSMVEGARGAEAGREADAPPTALRAIPPPRFAGRDVRYRNATSKMTISLTCSTAPSTSPVWPPICRVASQHSSDTTIASTTKATSACASPRQNSSAKNPSAAAIATLMPEGAPAANASPSLRAAGKRNITNGSTARAPTCAAISAGATSAISVRLAIASARMSSERISAHTP